MTFKEIKKVILLCKHITSVAFYFTSMKLTLFKLLYISLSRESPARLILEVGKPNMRAGQTKLNYKTTKHEEC
jgi:hypothetical protein